MLGIIFDQTLAAFLEINVSYVILKLIFKMKLFGKVFKFDRDLTTMKKLSKISHEIHKCPVSLQQQQKTLKANHESCDDISPFKEIYVTMIILQTVPTRLSTLYSAVHIFF